MQWYSAKHMLAADRVLRVFNTWVHEKLSVFL